MEVETVIAQPTGWWSNWLVSSGADETAEPVAMDAGTGAGPLASGFSVGGATAQSRFAGKSAIPIGTKTPQSVNDGGNTAPAFQPAPPTPAAPVAQNLVNVVAKESDRMGDDDNATQESGKQAKWQSAWEFDFKTWKWKIAGSSVEAFQNNKKLAEERELLAARRWGDGRDTLFAATADHEGPLSSSFAPPETQQQTKQKADIGPATLEDIGGLFDAKKSLRETVLLQLRHPGLMQALLGSRASSTTGILLSGPPGVGKTLLARAISREAQVHVEFISCSEIAAVEGGASRLRGSFQACRRIGPSVIVLDEVDALCPPRDSSSVSQNDPVIQTAAELLTLLDAKSPSPLVVIATTSRRHALDPGLTRPGRLDKEVRLGLPTDEEREDILRVLLRAAHANNALSPDVSIPEITAASRGYTPADLYAVCAESSFLAVKRAVFSLECGNSDSTCIPLSALSSFLLSRHSMEQFTTAQILAQTIISRDLILAALDRIRPSNLRSYEFNVEVPKVSFDDIGGLHEIKQELREALLWPVQHADLFHKLGTQPSRGVLLYGPPGTGKTLLAKAVASSCGANFLPVQGPQLLSMWLGESERNIREVFETARRSKPCVLFFDEIDAIAGHRGGSDTDAAVARVLNQLLVEMDGLSSSSDNGHVFVLAATNRPDVLDTALLRPGRFDSLVHVPLPDLPARRSIIHNLLGGHGRSEPDLVSGLEDLAAALEGYTGADVAELCNKAARQAIAEAVHSGAAFVQVGRRHVEEAYKTTRKSVPLSEVRRYEEIQQAIREGRPMQRPAAAQAGKKGAAGTPDPAVTAAVVQMMQRRIQELEAKCEAAGIAL